jgi:hypothetical protein
MKGILEFRSFILISDDEFRSKAIALEYGKDWQHIFFQERVEL